MRTKAFTATVTNVKATEPADGDAQVGTFEALVSVFGNIDSYGDRVVKGAFAKTLTDWAERGDPIPVVWSHQWSDPHAIIGAITEATETDDGLVVTGRLLLGAGTHADVVHTLMKERLITQFSFGFDITEGAWLTEGGREIYEIRDVQLFEVGPCLLGVNQSTELLDVKAQDRNPKAVDDDDAATVVSVMEQLAAVVEELRALLAPTDEDDEPSEETDPSKSVPPDAGKAVQAQTAARLNLITAGG